MYLFEVRITIQNLRFIDVTVFEFFWTYQRDKRQNICIADIFFLNRTIKSIKKPPHWGEKGHKILLICTYLQNLFPKLDRLWDVLSAKTDKWQKVYLSTILHFPILNRFLDIFPHEDLTESFRDISTTEESSQGQGLPLCKIFPSII